MPRKQSSKKFSRISKSLILLLISTLIFTLLFFLVGNFFLISEVEIIGSGKKPNLKGLEEFKGRNLLTIQEEEIKKILNNRNPQIKIIGIEKKYPQTITIAITTEKTFAALEVSQGFLVLGDRGKILSKIKTSKITSIPTISYYQKLNYMSYEPGEKIEFKDILSAIHFVKKLSELGMKTDKVDINGLNMIRLNLNGNSVIFTTEKDVELQDYQLEKLIYQFKIEGKTFKVLDLRFNKPIIKLK